MSVLFTSMDTARLFKSFTSLHVFELGIPSPPAQTVGRALAAALVHYYPLAGRVIQGPGGAAIGTSGWPAPAMACYSLQ